jgi:two-component system cell cycle sensor histidine kinase/response regulator CckA
MMARFAAAAAWIRAARSSTTAVARVLPAPPDRRPAPPRADRAPELVGDIAHDLNDLLTAIVGYSELLIARIPGPDPMAADAQEVRRSALSAAGLTRQLLAWSRRRRVPLETVDVNAVTTRTMGMLSGMLGAGITVTLRIGTGVSRVNAGASQIEEILLNVAMTARDAMPGGGRLTVATSMQRLGSKRAGGTGGEHVRITFADTGESNLNLIDSIGSDPMLMTCGSGVEVVGLAKAHDIVEQLGGAIGVESTPGSGTTVTIDLPAAPMSADAVDSPPPQAPDKSQLVPILVVDDDPRLRNLLKLLLARDGYEVLVVAGARDALEAVKQQPDIALLMIDVVMPEMSGYDLAREARKIAPAARVVFMSGFAGDPTRHLAGDRFLAKPFSAASLTRVVHEVLARA